MSTHSSGTGSGWKEDLDVDQPHGQDYVEFNDIRIGTRLRLSQEHSAFADSTVGGQHTPGGTGVLLVETTANMTTLGAAADLTSAHEFGLACNTATDPTGETLFYYGDDTVPVRLPVSWNNILTEVTHTFGSNSEITVGPPFVFQDRVDCSANLNVDSSADFSDAYVDGDISVKGSLKVAGDFSLTGDMAVDGTTNFNDAVDFSDVVFTGNFLGSAATFSIFGDITDKAQDTGGAQRTISDETGNNVNVFEASTDLFVSACFTGTGTTGVVRSFVGDASNAVTDLLSSDYMATGEGASLSMSVKKGEFWKITVAFPGLGTINETYHVRPIGAW